MPTLTFASSAAAIQRSTEYLEAILGGPKKPNDVTEMLYPTSGSTIDVRVRRDELDSLILASGMTSTELETVSTLYGAWADGVNYSIGDIVSYSGTLYKCCKSHLSETNRHPLDTSVLWKIGDTDTKFLMTIITPSAYKSQIESAFGVSLVGFANGSPTASGLPAFYGGDFVLDLLEVLPEIDSSLMASNILLFDKNDQTPSYPWITPGQSIELTDGANPFINCPKGAIFRDLQITANSPTLARTFLGITADVELLFFDRCSFAGQSKAISTPSSVFNVNQFKIRHCQAVSTKNRVFDCDNVSIDELQVSDNSMSEIHSAIFYFPEVCQFASSKASIERNSLLNSPSLISVPNGSYCTAGLVAMSYIEAVDNTTEGLKTESTTADTGSWEFRANHLIERRNRMVNCGHVVALPTGARRILNCKSGSGFSLSVGENLSGLWDDCEWLIEKSYFDSLSLPTPEIEIGDMNYRECELNGCTIDIARLMPLSANSRFLPSFKLIDTTILADVFVAEQNTYRGLLWFEHQVDTTVGEFVFENSTIELTTIENALANDCLIRFNRLLTGSNVRFTAFSFLTPDLDSLFYLLTDSQDSTWTFENSSTFDTVVNVQTWGANRPPNSIIGTVDII